MLPIWATLEYLDARTKSYYFLVLLHGTQHNLNFCHVLDRDEYKEFEKLTQEDLKEVDNRLEEEEVSFITFLHHP